MKVSSGPFGANEKKINRKIGFSTLRALAGGQRYGLNHHQPPCAWYPWSQDMGRHFGGALTESRDPGSPRDHLLIPTLSGGNYTLRHYFPFLCLATHHSPSLGSPTPRSLTEIRPEATFTDHGIHASFGRGRNQPLRHSNTRRGDPYARCKLRAVHLNRQAVRDETRDCASGGECPSKQGTSARHLC